MNSEPFMPLSLYTLVASPQMTAGSAWPVQEPGANKLTMRTGSVGNAAGPICLLWLRLLKAAIGLDSPRKQQAASRLLASAIGCCCCSSRQAGCSPITRKVYQVPGIVYDEVVDVLGLACMHDKDSLLRASRHPRSQAGNQHKRWGRWVACKLLQS